jgi:hypothetical protein
MVQKPENSNAMVWRSVSAVGGHQGRDIQRNEGPQDGNFLFKGAHLE